MARLIVSCLLVALCAAFLSGDLLIPVSFFCLTLYLLRIREVEGAATRDAVRVLNVVIMTLSLLQRAPRLINRKRKKQLL